MYFLVNASSPEPLDVATSNFADALVRSKAVICDGSLDVCGLTKLKKIISETSNQRQPKL